MTRFAQSLHTLGQKFRGPGGEAVVRDLHERVQRREPRPKKKRWEKVVMGMLATGAVVYTLIDKLG